MKRHRDTRPATHHGATMHGLFVTWEGAAQSYLRALYIPWMAALAQRGVRLSILHLTWAEQDELAACRAEADARGIPYEVLIIPRGKGAADMASFMARAAGVLRSRVRERHHQFVVLRSILPCALWLAAGGPSLVPAIFDADGLPEEERIDLGAWTRRTPAYWGFRGIELATSRLSRVTVTRTHAAAKWLDERAGRAPIVIPNGRDPSLFKPLAEHERKAERARHGIAPDDPWIVFLGSIGAQYMPEESFRLFARIRSILPAAKLSIMTGQVNEAGAALEAAGLTAKDASIARVSPAEVPALLAAADLGLALRRPSPSQRAVCPIKVAEFALSGLPIILTKGVGDLEEQLTGAPFDFLDVPITEDALAGAAHRFSQVIWPKREPLRAMARETGLRHFSLESVADRYAWVVESSLAR